MNQFTTDFDTVPDRISKPDTGSYRDANARTNGRAYDDCFTDANGDAHADARAGGAGRVPRAGKRRFQRGPC